ncbi:SDR family oxidoreductase [Aliishimia ponticola]|uniref:SDR family oxidoreductase n=1 Tax=Aliishimia ponticola TaxID=2499833 RepID=A0A4S4NJT3_9RHOB|nr:SDR family oxidoreductase [Aliishimia ponticola]THH39027.1 SDR family oxidoreductase [Aliishimia ponticola]
MTDTARKTLLITGASAGIGAACARLAAPDYDLYLNYRSDDAGAEAVKADCEAAGAKVTLLRADVSDPQALARMFDQIPRLDACINNAGIVAPTAPVAAYDHDRLRQMFDVNVIGAIMVARDAAAKMDGPGVIVNVSSAAARLGSGGQYVDYAASKAAIDTFTKGLGDELAADGIRVMSVRPGLIDTEIHAKGGEPGRAQRLAHMVPMRREGSAEEVARPILFLLSDGASYMTGSFIEVTGGR